MSMQTFRYSFIAKLLYRYGNIPLNLLLLLYLASSIIGLFSNWYYIFFILINSAIIFWLNKYYLKIYRTFPFTISIDDDKLICSDYFFSKQTIEIRFEDIDSITGGIFSGFPTRPTYIHDGRQNVTIGFYLSSGKFNELLILILKRINEELYLKLIERVKELQGNDSAKKR